jgi:hypothetical protein
MPKSPDEIPENIDFAAEELAEADSESRERMLAQMAKSLTAKLLRDNRRLGICDISSRVTRYVRAVRQKIENLDRTRQTP